MKLAVTAASGQLGSAIVNEAITQLGRQSIIGIARNPEKATHLGVEIRQGDYNNREQYQYALKGTEVVLLVSGTAFTWRLTSNTLIIILWMVKYPIVQAKAGVPIPPVMNWPGHTWKWSQGMN